jgi:cytoskeleton protein RodZ
VVLIALAALAALYVIRPRGGEPAPSAVSSPDAIQPAPAPAAAPPPAPAPPAAEIIALRRVWLRLVVDGARVVEREVEADTRIPVQSASQIVLRAGDAGAVRVSVAGKDQGPIGRAGQPATWSFAVKPVNGRTGEPVK